MSNPQPDARDERERIVLHNVAEFGWHCVNIIEDDGHPPWSFTIGIYETYDFPELIVIGRSRATAHHILDTIANALDKNDRLDLTTPHLSLLPGITCRFLEVHTRYYQDYVGFARWFYRKRHFPLYQIIWPNSDGLYPWDSSAPKSFKEWQPVLSSSSPSCDRDVATDDSP
jgi:hypothetical protein